MEKEEKVKKLVKIGLKITHEFYVMKRNVLKLDKDEIFNKAELINFYITVGDYFQGILNDINENPEDELTGIYEEILYAFDKSDDENKSFIISELYNFYKSQDSTMLKTGYLEDLIRGFHYQEKKSQG